MRLTPFVLGLAIIAGSNSALAATHSDFTKSFPLQKLKTFDFKSQHRVSRDPLANNEIWANNVREAIRTDLRAHGLTEATNGDPDFYVAVSLGLRDRYDINGVNYGWPMMFHRGSRRGGWWGWPGGHDVWAAPYTESTVTIDVIDAHTNQLVWRGYDTSTLNAGKPEKTLTKAVDNVLSRFYHDAKETPLVAQRVQEAAMEIPSLQPRPTDNLTLRTPSNLRLETVRAEYSEMPGLCLTTRQAARLWNVGGYQVQAPIGAGGMGVVYRALDTKLNRPVAIKLLSAASMPVNPGSIALQPPACVSIILLAS